MEPPRTRFTPLHFCSPVFARCSVLLDVYLDGLTLTLTESLEYEHLGVTRTFDGVSVEFRGNQYF